MREQQAPVVGLGSEVAPAGHEVSTVRARGDPRWAVALASLENQPTHSFLVEPADRREILQRSTVEMEREGEVSEIDPRASPAETSEQEYELPPPPQDSEALGHRPATSRRTSPAPEPWTEETLECRREWLVTGRHGALGRTRRTPCYSRARERSAAVTFRERLEQAIARNLSLLCIGLDPDPQRFPEGLTHDARGIVAFNRAIVEATSDLVCAYKPNLAFYLAHGAAGIEALAETRQLVPPEIPVILDAKLGDIASTSAAYAQGVFETLGFDAVTVHPYLGSEALEPFFAYADRGVFVLVRTSNPGAVELQDAPVGEAEEPLYLWLADRVREWNERYGNLGIVAGATYPVDLALIRQRCPDLPLLAPGVGAQGGDLEEAVRAGISEGNGPLIVTVSRSVLYASRGSDFAQAARDAARRLRDRIERVRAEIQERAAGL